jgi:LPXTG-motif cell wall-anchored protein
VAPQLPATGTGGGRLALLIGTALILLGGIVLIGSSRFAEPAD